MMSSQKLLLDAVALRRSYAEKYMASIEFDGKVLSLANCLLCRSRAPI